jgi:phage terminase large subunit GpA-like protein
LTNDAFVWNAICQFLHQKPILTGSQWADTHFMLSPESSATPGKWKTYPWQRDILDAMTDYTTKIIVIKKPTRVGFTKLLGIVHAYFIDQRPSVQLHYQPNDDEARGYAEDEFEPMVRDNAIIAKHIETPNTRGRIKKEKTVKKLYPGGYIEILGSESDRNLNRRTARVVVGDEVDTWKKEAGKAGDTIMTMFRRSSDFWDRKNIIGGKVIGAAYNPEIEELDGISMIDYWYQRGTQEYRHWPCPHCGHFNRLEFEDMLWEKDIDENSGKTIKHYPNTAHFKCKSCGNRIEDKHKREMDKSAKWVAENPDAQKDGIRSFHPWAMVSYSPNVTWPDIVREFLAASKSRLKLKAFYSEVLARTWEEDYERADTNTLHDRREEYAAQVPHGVLVLTFGADTQDDRIECEIVGWGANEESWSIDYKIFHGDTSKPEVWAQFDEYLMKTWHHEDGGIMRPYAGLLDTQGHRAKEAYAFCKQRFARRVFASKGHNQKDAPIAPRLASRKNKANVPLFLIGVNQAKDVIYSHIKTESPGAGYMHFPNEPIYGDEYFAQLTAEQRDKTGAWKKRRARNETLDCRVLAYASVFVAGIDLELLAKRGQPILIQQEQPKKKQRKSAPKNYLEEF